MLAETRSTVQKRTATDAIEQSRDSPNSNENLVIINGETLQQTAFNAYGMRTRSHSDSVSIFDELNERSFSVSDLELQTPNFQE